ncbi:HAD family hydrolase [Marispirochaeta sp.]|jgi:putative hydrolase of the HAD superfamily|uniref:HAD family hydrolase n=1 Tax=Marispirochaeta sp. TaxID=2038653 RepID=UPI0029C680E0|nr:HAD family hydrolase [Marispirochaeta sp.]
MSSIAVLDYRRLFTSYCSPLEPEATDVSPHLPGIDNIEAVLFDVYGTLVISSSGDIGTIMDDSRGDIFSRMVKDELSLTLPENIIIDDLVKEEILQDHKTKRDLGTAFPEVEIRFIWQRVLKKIFPAQTYRSISQMAEDMALLHELSRNRVWPMPGSRKLLEQLRNNFRLGIVSNAQFYTPLMMSSFFKDSYSAFEEHVCVWSYREGIAKPDPALFKKALFNLGREYLADPSRVLYVGNDMLNDITPASSAGMRTLLFAGDSRSLRMRNDDPRVAGVRPDRIVNSLDQIVKILGVGE